MMQSSQYNANDKNMVYLPRANGQVERKNCIIVPVLAKVGIENP